MQNEIKNNIERQIPYFLRYIDRDYSLSSISPILFSSISDFICAKGKRLRPTLFIIGYLGYCKKVAAGLYRSALSIELLHDFMLIHDDIIDKSDTRRGRPSMHAALGRYLRKNKKIKFSGQDLAIIAGDIIYALGLNAFLCVKENPLNKEAAMKKLIAATVITGSGEFIELIYGLKDIRQTTLNDIYKIYDLKTANYTFAYPLTIGATLAGAADNEIKRLFKYGICLGRAFQIKDDILGLFAKESETGKSAFTDLREAKKTILIWHAYRHSPADDKNKLNRILSGGTVTRSDLNEARRIVGRSGALDYAKKEILSLCLKAEAILEKSRIKTSSKNILRKYSKEILKL